ncbi:MAG: TRAP transporter small permease [Gammaproteobacteria bacterium]
MSESNAARLLFRAASVSAVSGGVLLCALAGITVISVISRALLSLPIPGDFEIVGMGTAIAAFLCLPYCQLQRGQVRADLLLDRASPRVAGILDAIGGLLCAAIAAVFAWRMVPGLGDAWRDGDVTVILGLPLWWAYPFAICAFALLAACCLYTASQDIRGR